MSRIYFSVNNPETYYITSGETINEELKFLECLRPLSDIDEINFVMSHESEFVELALYPGVLKFDGDYVPPKKEVHCREVKHLTFSLGDLIAEALK